MAEGIHHVPGLVEAQVHSMNEVWEVLQTGSSARAVGSTNANEHSSRSHWCAFFSLSDKYAKFNENDLHKLRKQTDHKLYHHLKSLHRRL